MLLFSTKLPINATLTPDEFVKLVIEWNQGSPYDRINNLNWDGLTKNIKFEEGKRFLAIEEVRMHNIVAARFRKEDENNIIWTSDFILNYEERKISIKLEREATENTTIFFQKFNVPYLVKMIIRKGYLDTDHFFEISDSPIDVNKNNCEIIKNIILKQEKCILPVIYVTKTWSGRYPINVEKLAQRLQGVAHVLCETDPSISKWLKEKCNDQNVHHGGIGIYYPNTSAATKRINSSRYLDNEDFLLDKIVKYVIRYSNQQIQEHMYTWEGIQNELLRLRYESLAQKRNDIENENKELYEVFNEQLKEQATTISELSNRISALEQENSGLHNKLNGMDEIPLLFFGEEDELYDGEIREILLDILSDNLKEQKVQSRRWHILNDIIENNKFQNTPKLKANEIKRILKGYSNMTTSMRQKLQEMGFQISGDGKHYKLTYYDDSRYTVTMSKTGSDTRAGDNLSSQIIKNLF